MHSFTVWHLLACVTLLLQLGVLWAVLRLGRVARTWWVWPALFLALGVLLFRRVTILWGLFSSGRLPNYPATEITACAIAFFQFVALWRLYEDLREGREAQERLAEATRAGSEWLFRTLFERSGDSVLLLETRAEAPPVIVDVNDAALASHGYRREQLVGQPVTILEPDLGPEEDAQRRDQLHTASQALFVTRHRRRDGSLFDVEILTMSAPVQGRNLLLSIERDITARLQAERELAASEARLREAARMARLGWWEADHLAGHATWSEELYRMYRLDPAGGAPAFEKWSELLHPGDREAATRTWREHLARRSPRAWRQYRILGPGGEVRHILSHIRTEFAPDGTPLRSFGTDQDVTGQVQLAAEREKALSLLSATFESTSEGLLVTDGEGRISGFNRRFLDMWGLEPDQVRDAREQDLAAALVPKVADPGAFLARIRQIGADPLLVASEEVLLRDGRVFERHSSPRQEGGEVAGRLWSFRDITPRRKAEEERLALEQQFHHLQRMESVGRLAGGISHDMNNVLAAIMSVAEVMKIKGEASPGQLDLILDAARRGRTLMRGLLAFARKEMEEAEHFDLNEVVRREAELLSSTTLQKVRLELDLAPDLPRLVGSSAAIATALMNLCVNAMDAMPDGGRLALRTRPAGGDSVELVVEDDGQGMPPEVASRAMEPFFTTKPSGKGTGLGLSMVFGTVQAHGGNCEIQSRPGQGTRVRVVLPVAAAGPGPGAEPPGRDEGAGSGASLRILLVDDDPLVRTSVPEMLSLQGHRVTPVPGGREALAALEAEGNWDLVVLDLNMPGMDGLETLTRLRGLAPLLPVLLTTGFLGERASDRLSELGPVSVLLKPYSAEEIRRATESLLAGN
ncbi:MAG TPA: PAS domain S-box protein [Holophaga sp.]|nr:PAS domain S-box protein [Holophaga sp.]